MDGKRQIFRNLNWNWAGTLADSVVAFLLCPYLLTKLGAAHYGAWVMIGSLTGYFGLLDLGVRGSVGRYVAFYRARKDPQAINEIVMTAFALLSVAGLLGLIGTAIAAIWAGPLMGGELPAADLPDLRLALLLAGVNLGLQLPLNVAEGVLWGCQRFDQLNAVRIPFDIARGVLSAAVVFCSGGLVALSAVALLLTLAGGIVKTVQAFRCEPALKWRLGRVDRGRMREVFSFGIWSTVSRVPDGPTVSVPISTGVENIHISISVPGSKPATLMAMREPGSRVTSPFASRASVLPFASTDDSSALSAPTEMTTLLSRRATVATSDLPSFVTAA